jgi:hypothetical protein
MRIIKEYCVGTCVTSSRTNVSGMKTGHHDETRPTPDLLVSLGAKTGNSLRLLRGLWHSKLEESDFLLHSNKCYCVLGCHAL